VALLNVPPRVSSLYVIQKCFLISVQSKRIYHVINFALRSKRFLVREISCRQNVMQQSRFEQTNPWISQRSFLARSPDSRKLRTDRASSSFLSLMTFLSSLVEDVDAGQGWNHAVCADWKTFMCYVEWRGDHRSSPRDYSLFFLFLSLLSLSLSPSRKKFSAIQFSPPIYPPLVSSSIFHFSLVCGLALLSFLNQTPGLVWKRYFSEDSSRTKTGRELLATLISAFLNGQYIFHGILCLDDCVSS